jgi:hypothetical protein
LKSVGARKEIMFGTPSSTQTLASFDSPAGDITLFSPSSGVKPLGISGGKGRRVSFEKNLVVTQKPTSVCKPTLKKVSSTSSDDSGIGGEANEEVPKHYQKRHSEFYRKKFNFRTPALRCAVAIHNFLRVAKSPRTKATFPIIARKLPQFQKFIREEMSSRSIVKQQKELAADLRRIVAFRKDGKTKEIRAIRGNWLRNKMSLRFVSRVTDTTFSYLQWLVKPPSLNSRSFTELEKQHTVQYFAQNNITMQLPLKRHAHKFFFRTAFCQIYAKYAKAMKEQGLRVLSKSSVLRVLPRKHFKTVSKVPIQGCLCCKCENLRLILCALKFAKVKGFSRRIRESVMKVVCNGTGCISNVKRDCLKRKCDQCRHKINEIFEQENHGLDKSARCAWHQWTSTYVELKNGKRKRVSCVKVLSTGTIGQLINLASLQLEDMPLHLFDVQWQGDQFEIAKQTLKPGEVLTVMDFAKNFKLPRQGEVQYGFFCRESVTLHPVVCYFHCPKCEELMVDEVMMFSNDTKHDAHAVEAFQNQALKHLKSKHDLVPTKLISFTDNCSGQYKCHQAFAYMSGHEIPQEKHYFGAGHGKGPGDASVGRAKKELDLAIRGGKAELHSAEDVAKHCQEHLEMPTSRELCAHRNRHFYFVDDIDRSYISPFGTVDGTMSFHSVKVDKNDPLKLCTRVSSCFCR